VGLGGKELPSEEEVCLGFSLLDNTVCIFFFFFLDFLHKFTLINTCTPKPVQSLEWMTHCFGVNRSLLCKYCVIETDIFDWSTLKEPTYNKEHGY